MDANFHILPPQKRFRFIQQHEQEREDEVTVNSSRLPAKKRKESRDSSSGVNGMGVNVSYCLPAKKRVWALPPDSIFENPLLPLDLNVEYKPSFEDDDVEVKIPRFSGDNQSIECSQEGFGDQVDDDDDDDGIVCAVCESTDGDPSDPIVFCDGCDLMVHTTCYGNPLVKDIPEGEWFCSQCLGSNSSELMKNDMSSCCLCTTKGGAMKPTNDGLWAHIVCALYVPEVFFEDPEGREGIDCSKVPKKRWEENCYVCKKRNGCVIDCSEPKCHMAFHVTCGLKEDLCIEYKEKKNKGAIVAGFCKTHTELWKKQQQTGKFKIVARE